MPIIQLAVQGPGGLRSVGCVVDIGADKTLLPKSFAKRLGIDLADLEETDGSDGAGGVSFPTWELSKPLPSWVIVQWPQPRGLEMWGPEIALVPEWADDTIPLLGRAGFFNAFNVTFEQNGGPRFHLEYEDPDRTAPQTPVSN
jgi:hypothetical protein